MKKLNLKIDLTKIDKANIFNAESGAKYLDATIVFRETEDKYGNIGFISQVFLKDNRKDGDEWVKTPIIGNVKEPFKPEEKKPAQVPEVLPDDIDDLPF